MFKKIEINFFYRRYKCLSGYHSKMGLYFDYVVYNGLLLRRVNIAKIIEFYLNFINTVNEKKHPECYNFYCLAESSTYEKNTCSWSGTKYLEKSFFVRILSELFGIKRESLHFFGSSIVVSSSVPFSINYEILEGMMILKSEINNNNTNDVNDDKYTNLLVQSYNKIKYFDGISIYNKYSNCPDELIKDIIEKNKDVLREIKTNLSTYATKLHTVLSLLFEVIGQNMSESVKQFYPMFEKGLCSKEQCGLWMIADYVTTYDLDGSDSSIWCSIPITTLNGPNTNVCNIKLLQIGNGC